MSAETELSLSEIVGLIGEATAIRHLHENGFKISRADMVQTVGHTLMSEDALDAFDCYNLRLLSQLCGEYFHCEVRSQPCRNASSDFFLFNSLCNDNMRMLPNTGDNLFRYHCARKMTSIAVLNKCSEKCNRQSCPIRSYLSIDNYISYLPTLNRMLNTEAGINNHKSSREEFSKRIGKRSEILRCYDNLYDHRIHTVPDPKYDLNDPAQLKEYLKSLKGHPGRIDLFGYKNKKHYCLEVKTNSSRLSKWQIIRLNWMKEQGFSSVIVRTKLRYGNKEELRAMHNSLKVNEIIEKLRPTVCMETFELSNYLKFRDIIPTYKDVEFYNCLSLAGEIDIKAIYDKHELN